VHAVLLTVRFVDPESFNRVFQDTPLEVILVNTKPTNAPTRPRPLPRPRWPAVARPTRAAPPRPLPPSALTEMGDAPKTRSARSRPCRSSRRCCWRRSRSSWPPCPRPTPSSPAQYRSAAREEKRRQLIKLLAEIEKRINEENARPKKRYISPATREEVYAIYYDNLRRRIEDRGTQNFPELAGKKLYGELTMIVTVNHDGRVLATEIVETSGITALDRRAQTIARNAGPFGKFSDAMRAAPTRSWWCRASSSRATKCWKPKTHPALNR
jgi:protein TonB